LSNVLNYLKKNYLVVRRASLHGNLLAQQSDVVVPGKRRVLSVQLWGILCQMCGGLERVMDDWKRGGGGEIGRGEEDGDPMRER
jgi:hypothetical protein